MKHTTIFNRLSALLIVASFTFVAQAASVEEILYDRGAAGDIREAKGATRLKGDQSEALKNAIDRSTVKNVILLIGDGMGDSEITVARNYAKGAGGYFKGIDGLPFTGHYTHYSLDKESGKPNYVTDSAASGTAWASGVKSYNGAIGVDLYGKPHPTILQLAKKSGKATGNVTTAEIQDATPAVLMAHVTARKCYGPEATTTLCPTNALENGGLGSITEQILTTRADLILGGGAKTFKEAAKAGEWSGSTLEEQAKSRGFTFVRNKKELEAITIANQDQPLIGLFAEGNMPVRWLGPIATYGGNKAEKAVKCELNPKRTDQHPSLAEMTDQAIQLLSHNEKGFFLQVEGASIDKENHAANSCGQIGETVDLDEAVQVALEFAKKAGDTLVIVTADHAHSSQIVPNDASLPGLSQTLITEEGAMMTISYGNSETDSQNHTGSQVRVAAFGPNGANVMGLIDQTDLFYIMRDAMGLPAESESK